MKKVMGFLFLSVCLLILAPLSFAETDSPSSRPTLKETREDLITARKDLRIAKLNAAKLNVCQKREKTITNRLESLTKLVATQETSFDKIATRVENFYTTKVVPTGKTVPTYDTLVSDIAVKKAAVDASLTTAKTNASSFSCTANDPKGVLTQFNTDMKAVKTALNNYRTSIRNLIVAVKSVVGEEKENPSPTPKSTP